MLKKILADHNNRVYFERALDRFLPLKPYSKPAKDIVYFHVLGPNFFKDSANILPYLDGLEIKPANFAKGSAALFSWRGAEYVANKEGFASINQSRDRGDNGGLLKAQFHFPNSVKDADNNTLDLGNLAHHDKLLTVFKAYFSTIEEFNFGPNITVHPPLLKRELHNNVSVVQEVLNNANIFFRRLGVLIEESKVNVIIGVENQSNLDSDAEPEVNLGYALNHLMTLVDGTNSKIQFTVDRGHRYLTEEFNVDALVFWSKQNGKHIANFHFHGNAGLNSPVETVLRGARPEEVAKVLDDPTKARYDAHWIPSRGQAIGYSAYIIRAVAEGIPLDLELMFNKIIRHHGEDYLIKFLKQLRAEINLAYEMITKRYNSPDSII